MCDMSIAVVNIENSPDLRLFSIRWSDVGRRTLVQGDHDDVLWVEVCVRARGTARIKPNERGERPEAEEHCPYHEHEKKLQRLSPVIPEARKVQQRRTF